MSGRLSLPARASCAVAALLLAVGCAAGGSDTAPDAAPTGSTGAPTTDGEPKTVTDTPDDAAARLATPPSDASDTPPATPSHVLQVRVQATDVRSAADAPLRLFVEARNATTAGTDLLLWNTPFEPVLSADTFRVTRDGEPVAYRGRVVKRALPPPDDAVVRLMPGETIERAVELSRHYAVDVPGTYAIEFVPGRLPIDDGTEATAGFATLVAADEDPVVVERR